MKTRTLPLIILYIGIAISIPSPILAGEPVPEAIPAETPVEQPEIRLSEETNEYDPSPEIPGSEAGSASNVLFLPGIKGSRLYDGDGNKLWEPFGDHDIEALMLDTDGKSLRGDIYIEPGDIVDSVAGITDIYGSFMDFMDGLVEDGTINAWTPVAYDWRLSLPDIVNAGMGAPGPMPMSTLTYAPPPIRAVLENLSQDSQTGKVTIVAHSNGGLVAKQLMLSLGEEETRRLIDKVILVGVPQSGAPQALGALLYGYKEGLPWWFPGIVSTAAARSFAENSPMGYHLLPSSAYFIEAEHPVARFVARHAYTEEREAYGETIDTFDELRSFALAEDGGREKPHPGKFWDANVLNESLLGYAQDVHAEIDAWTPPPGVDVYQIAGWGEDTVAGIEYYERCVFSVCKEMYRPTFIEDGDGVVPISSGHMMPESDSVKNFWFDLLAYNDRSPFDKDHGNLLAAPEMKAQIKNILSESKDALPEYFSSQVPSKDSRIGAIRFFLHSPLTIELVDDDGNRISTEAREIPGASYGEFGDVKYISAPAGTHYRVELHGYDSGTFTLEVQESDTDGNIDEAVFADLPVTPDTIARVELEGTVDSLTSLSIDSDGDGQTDLVTEPDTESILLESEPHQRHGSYRKPDSGIRASESELQLEVLLLELRDLLLKLLRQLEKDTSARAV